MVSLNVDGATSGTRVDAAGLADLAARIDYATAPAEVQDRTVSVIVDTLCAIGLGAQNEQLRALRRQVADGQPGPATVIGSREPTGPSDACFLNGSAAAVQTLDEGHRLARGHAAIHVVPAVLAAAERGGFSGRDLCSAVLAGYEVAVRVSLMTGPLAPSVHPHGNWGAVGAAAGVAHLLTRGDRGGIATAIDAAAACVFTGYMQTAMDGVDAHFLFAGFGAHAGLATGTVATLGWSVTEGALGAFFVPRSSGRSTASEVAGATDVTGATDVADVADFADPDARISYEILHNYFKRWSTCGHVQPTNDAVENIVRRSALDGHSVEWAGSVESVEVATYDVAATMSRRDVGSPLAAGFSIPVTVAIALLHGSSALYDIGPDLLHDPEVLRLADRVVVVGDPDLTAGYPTSRPSRVTISFRDGSRFEEQVTMSRGDAKLPLPADLLEQKWRAQLSSFVVAGRESEVLAALLDLPGRDTVDVMSTLRRLTR